MLEARYLRRDDGGDLVETPRDMFRRVARAVAEAELRLHGPDEAERWERTFLERFLDLELLPNSPTLMNAGTELGQLSACFVLPVPDSVDGIFRSLHDMALIQKSGGGTGFAFSRLRPRGARIASTGGASSGPVSFMQVFECATEQIAQGGRRRAANMGILRVDHPDIEEFVDAKRRLVADGGRGEGRFRWPRFGELVRIGIRFLDDILEVNRFPLAESGKISRANPKVGLGVMGFAEALVRLDISYHSDEAVSFATSVAERLTEEALEASRELATLRGRFPNWERSRLADGGAPVRNATRTAIAPTGTISIIAGTSPGIGPFFSLAYRHVGVLGGETLRTVNPLVEGWAKRLGVEPRGVLAQLRRGEPLGDVPDEMRRLFMTALEIPAERHLEIQAAFQAHVDNAVSKTVDPPEAASVEEVEEIYRRAWELGLKGITVFRHRSKEREVLRAGVDDEGDGGA